MARLTTASEGSPAVSNARKPGITKVKNTLSQEANIMVNACMNQHLIGTLQALIGSTLCALECPRIDEWRETYCHALIVSDRSRVQISNEETDIDYFNGVEGLPIMTCQALSAEEKFSPFPNHVPDKYTLTGTVTSVDIVNETIALPGDSYELKHTVAIFIGTDKGSVCLCSTGIFDENIRVGIDEPLENCLPSMEQVTDEWRDSPSDTVHVTRHTTHLDSMPSHTH